MITIKRNGRIYDRVNPDTLAWRQYLTSLADSHPLDLWEAFNGAGELQMSVVTTRGGYRSTSTRQAVKP